MAKYSDENLIEIAGQQVVLKKPASIMVHLLREVRRCKKLINNNPSPQTTELRHYFGSWESEIENLLACSLQEPDEADKPQAI